MMINEYLRPVSITEAVELLKDENKNRKPLGGGTSISRQRDDTFGVVDLQNVGLDYIEQDQGKLIAGATVPLVEIYTHRGVHPEIKRAIHIEANENIRNMATIGGWVISGKGRSILSTLLLALDTTLTWEPGANKVRMGDWLPLRDQESPGLLLTELVWWNDISAAFEYVARTPKDQPILVVAAAQWSSGRTRIALGGYGESPIIAFDGTESSGVDIASRDAYFDADDQWATAEYRREVAAKLALRCVERIEAMKESEA
jgi:CO/xanthine dehydrogenase FAD-binding subunit